MKKIILTLASITCFTLASLLASVNMSYANACYDIKDWDMKQVCLKGVRSDACYGIKNWDLKQVCLQGAKTDACYSIKDWDLKQVCIKGTQSEACFGIKNWDAKESCKKFSNTTLWILLIGHGYIPEGQGLNSR